ncbi:hypothetical protein [Methylobacterium nodulans]|uniref:Uncharacterized protein n=1 Tax=Methylobacterium nodulans (strain LMG 21967 / CNCM I-2342 / ORS 2060) TaxID=460265 RepID=B8IXV6_METNO|nr:hypothetical protein [Methylobacterium nodulans]ACL63246.1 conserved hypothetical protein [Methylobacterium nodulans ORS 2060]
MPAKVRRAKRRSGPSLDAYAMVFETGHDFFGDLGFGQGSVSDEHARAAAREAWPELGAAFLQERADRLARPDAVRKSDQPWALETFGPPPGWRR